MPSKTIDYINRKNELQKSIDWYAETIEEVQKQQDNRRDRLNQLFEELDNLNKDYYTNG